MLDEKVESLLRTNLLLSGKIFELSISHVALFEKFISSIKIIYFFFLNFFKNKIQSLKSIKEKKITHLVV